MKERKSTMHIYIPIIICSMSCFLVLWIGNNGEFIKLNAIAVIVVITLIGIVAMIFMTAYSLREFRHSLLKLDDFSTSEIEYAIKVESDHDLLIESIKSKLEMLKSIYEDNAILRNKVSERDIENALLKDRNEDLNRQIQNYKKEIKKYRVAPKGESL